MIIIFIKTFRKEEIRMMNIVSLCASRARKKIREFFSKESGEVNIVAIVVLIGIAVLLAIIFRGFIENLLKSLFGTIENNAQNAIN